MNAKKINLNLLQALDALLTEAHVTRAAKKLFITQSAMSNALNQLRDVFQDDLLVRGPEGMLLTPKAETLQPKLHQMIRELQQLTAIEPVFEAEQSDRVFNIGMSDIAEFLLLPEILKQLRKEAPNVQLEIQHVNHVTSLVPFKKKNIEIACGCLVDDIPHLTIEDCFTFNGVVIARRDHPLMQTKMTLKQYLSAKHIRVKYQARLAGTNIDQTLEKLGKKRDTVVTLAHIIPTLFLLQNTDLIASTPACFSQKLTKKLSQLPFRNI